ncbi:MAG TPA: outer membrane beta-barrel protein [Polyangiaceae bacterium]|nr:outer membrane beta-barrel protein [Polyangiaceae bacterium]
MKHAWLARLVLGAALFAAGSLRPRTAAADILGSVSAGALGGYGFDDALKVGIGARAGYTFPFKLYAGGTFVYHLGKTESLAGIDVKANVYYYGVEAGYDIDTVPLLIVRPYLGLGRVTGVAKVGDESSTDSKFGVWPGAAAIIPLGGLFVGADARYLIVSEYDAFSVFGSVGLKF